MALFKRMEPESCHLTLTKLSPFHEVRKSNTLPDMLHATVTVVETCPLYQMTE